MDYVDWKKPQILFVSVLILALLLLASLLPSGDKERAHLPP